MKIKIISDLHLEVNKEEIFYDDDVFTIIAGDISSNVKKKVSWVNANIKYGLYVAGNHIVYKKDSHCLSLQSKRKYLENIHTLNKDISFLHNNYKIIDNKVFIGCTLYTDYNYPCPPYYFNQQDNMYEALKGLNDFNKSYYIENGKIVKLHPKHYINEFKQSYKFLNETIKQFQDKECIIITHYAPSSKSIQEEFLGDKLNASYVSELENFILDNPNIKYWIHGHLHTYHDYKIGDTRIICNARGYTDYEKSIFIKNYIIDI